MNEKHNLGEPFLSSHEEELKTDDMVRMNMTNLTSSNSSTALK
jgi:hypothetical protein